MAMAPSSGVTGIEPEVGGRIGLHRHFTTEGAHPYDQVSWERRTSRITNYRDASVAFEQPDVEVPVSWSLHATNILAQKYFRGALGTPERETSLRQVADRVVDTIAAWGRSDGYFADEAEAEAFADELKYLIVTQRGAFNSPVWFNIGAKGRKKQASACQPFHALVNTVDGLVPIGRLVEADAVGTKVFDAHGLTRIVATKANGRKPVLRLHTRAGYTLDVTADHQVWKMTGGTRGRFVEAGSLVAGDALEWRRTESWGIGEITKREVSEAALAGWMQSDGFVGQYDHGTNRSLTIEAMTVTDAELEWVEQALDVVFPHVHRHQRLVATQDKDLDCRRTRLYGSDLEAFVDRWSLLDRRTSMTFPSHLHTAPLPVVTAYLRSIFQAEGYVFERESSAGIGMDMISEHVVRGVQALLLRFGIYSRVRWKPDYRANRVGCWSLSIRPLCDRRRFADEIGFVDPMKAIKLMMTLELPGRTEHDRKALEIERVEQLGEMDVYDIQTESGEYLSGSLRVHNCFILSVDDTMDSILNWYVEEGTIFKGGSGAGVNLSRIRSSAELLKGGGTASGPVSFMRGADASAGTIKSGGATRRAAKMVILNADHPDIEDFVWCKAVEERKARVLREAGFDMDLDGKDSHSTQYQNANNSVRVTDEFMQAVVDDGDWHLRAVTTGEIVRTVRARDLMHQISQSTWECADPGMQFDTTINRWHTAASTGRINGSNPCCFVGETLIDTSDGLIAIEQLATMSDEGSLLPAALSVDLDEGAMEHREIIKAWIAGYTNELVEVTTRGGIAVRCTAEHRFLTSAGEYRAAGTLEPGTELRAVDGNDFVASVERISVDEPVAVYDLEVEGAHNFAVAAGAAVAGRGPAIIVHNSEYMHLDNSACNLASINLLAFLDEEENRFDVEGFQHAVEMFFTAQEILVGNADYPTDAIAENSRRFRQLGLGYANLGALLMALGLPYDSDAGRAWAGALTAILTGHAYAISARTAARMGPFAGYTENTEHMLRVLRMHRDELAEIGADLVPVELLEAARADWDDAVVWGETFGVRNSQATVLAPTGCLVGGSLVTTERGLVRLRSLGDPDGPQWQDLGVGVATDEGVRQASQFYVNGLERVVDVVTARGHRIQGTTTHRVKVVDEAGAWVWRRMADLKPGDRVPLALGRLVGSPQHVALPPLSEAYWTGEHHARAPKQMTVELAELVGYFMGDGSLHSRGLRFCVADTDLDVIDRLRVLGKELFGLEAHVEPSQGYHEVAFHSVRLVAWWEACGLAKHQPSPGHTGKGWTPHIPDAVLHANDPAVYAGFVRGLFEADGTVTAGYPCWTTTSRGFSHEVQSLLLALGFPTTRRFGTSGRGSALAVLRLMNVSQGQRWTEEIGFLGNRKNAAVWSRENLQSARYDHIPITRAMVDQLVPENGRLRRVLLMELARGKVSRRIATELYESTGNAELGHLLDFFYDTVASATLGDEELTYDLSVPDNLTYLANGFVSHNTIGLLMDCDTTGVEPDLGLCKMKKLVGGGTMTIVNQTVPRALRRLGYDQTQVNDIVAYIDEHKTILGAPHLTAEHVPVFACSMGDNAIHYQGHIRMMGAVQHWISGAISKTVNMPEEATVEDVEQLHIDAWKLGIKAVAIYRDNCKVAQPLSMAKKEIKPEELVAAVEAAVAVAPAQVVERIVEKVVMQPVRKKLPRNRRSRTFEFRVADCKGFVTVGEYDDGRPGELFLRVSKQGSTLAGIMDAFAISVSHGLQYGVPLKAFIEAFTNMRFEPAGMTDDADIRFASSLVDYIFRRLAVDYLPLEERMELGILSVGERHNPTLPGIEEATTETSAGLDVGVSPPDYNTTADLDPVTATVPAPVATARPTNRDAPYCMQCGVQMIRAGSCHACPSCGTTSGCS